MAKKKATTWLEADVYDALELLAKKSKKTVSQCAAERLRVSVLGVDEPAGLDEVVRRMELLLRDHERTIQRRMATLLGHAVLETSTTRRMVGQLMGLEFEDERVRELQAECISKAVAALASPTGGMLEALLTVLAELLGRDAAEVEPVADEKVEA